MSADISESTPYRTQDILKLLLVSTQASGSLLLDSVLQLTVGRCWLLRLRAWRESPASTSTGEAYTL